MEIYLKQVRRSKEKEVIFWRRLKIKDATKNNLVIDDLKKKRSDFKIRKENTEETFIFNGNNYLITTISTNN